VPIPQTDAEQYEGEDTEPNYREERDRLGRDRFRDTVRYAYQQTVVSPSFQSPTFLSTHTSPALSDTTLIGEDYLALPIQHFDEVDLTDRSGRYAEEASYNLPEVVEDDIDITYSNSTKAGKGLEVRVEAYPLALSPGGLYPDDRQKEDYSYLGSEGIDDEKSTPVRSRRYDYKPVPLRWRFVLSLLGGLIVFLAMWELALRLLPDASHMDGSLSVFQNVSEIRKRSPLSFNSRNSTANLPQNDDSSNTDGNDNHDSDNDTGGSDGSDNDGSKDQGSENEDNDNGGDNSDDDSNTDGNDNHDNDNNTSGSDGSDNDGGKGQGSENEDIDHGGGNNGGDKNDSDGSGSPTKVNTTVEGGDQTTPPAQPVRTEDPEGEPTGGEDNLPAAPSTTNTTPRSPDTSSTKTPSRTTTSTTTTTSDPQKDSSSSSPRPTPADTTRPHHHWPTTTDSATSDSDTHGHPSPSPTTPTSTETETEEATPPFSPSPSPSPPPPDSSPPHPTNKHTITSTTPVQPPIQTDPTSDAEGSPDATTTITPKPPGNDPTGNQKPPTEVGQMPTQGTAPTTAPKPPGNGQTGDHGPTATTLPHTDDPISNHNATEIIISLPVKTTTTDKIPPAASTGSGTPHQPDGPIRNNTGIPDDLTTTTATSSPQGSPHGGLPGEEGTTATTTMVTITSRTRILGAQQPPTSAPSPPVSDHSPADQATPTVHATAFTTITLKQETDTPSESRTTTLTTQTTVTPGIVVQTTVVLTLPHVKAAEPLTTYVQTTTFADGTVSTITRDVLDNVTAIIEYDSSGHPTSTQYKHILTGAQNTTLLDPLGLATATVEFYAIETTSTLYDSDDMPTATIITEVAETVSWSTIYDENGNFVKSVRILMPIPTSTVAPAILTTATPARLPSDSNDQRTLKLHRVSDGVYFVGLMLPTLLAVLVTVPLKILNQTVKLYQGFHALSSDRGASAADSLWLKTAGPASFVDGLMSFKSGHYLLGLTTVLVIIGAFTIPFSAEVVRLVLEGPGCHTDKTSGNTITCSVVLGVYPVLAQALSVLTIILIIGVIGVAVILRRWKTGLERNPWNISDMARLAAGTDMRKILERLRRHSQPGYRVDNQDFVNKLRTKTFGLRPWEENGVMKYSVLILTQRVDDNVKSINKAGRSVAFADQANNRLKKRFHWPNPDFLPFSILSFTGRILFMILLSGVLIAVITYDVVARGSEYRRGLTGKAIGVRFLFCGAGVLVTFAWGSFFHGKAILNLLLDARHILLTIAVAIAVAFLSPYKQLHSKRLNKSRAIAMTPPTNPFTGVWLAFVPSRRDVYLGLVSATAILSELLPVCLGNIPCNGVQVQSAETICVYLSAAILSIMILIVGASFFVDRPTGMGIDPSTIAGAMYAAHTYSVNQPLRRFFKEEVTSIV